VQPFIENAIWHGLRPLENRKGFISVHFKYINNNKVCCIIEDDGIGREASGKNNKNGVNHRSKGINIVNERLLVTSKLRGDTFRLEITDLYNDRTETGTKVIVEIPSNITR
jgi:sensor histidine kinase YesM